jgi:hypothetical protein
MPRTHPSLAQHQQTTTGVKVCEAAYDLRSYAPIATEPTQRLTADWAAVSAALDHALAGGAQLITRDSLGPAGGGPRGREDAGAGRPR